MKLDKCHLILCSPMLVKSLLILFEPITTNQIHKSNRKTPIGKLNKTKNIYGTRVSEIHYRAPGIHRDKI